MPNEFLELYRAWPEKQLLDAFNNRRDYQEEAVEAMRIALRERGLDRSANITRGHQDSAPGRGKEQPKASARTRGAATGFRGSDTLTNLMLIGMVMLVGSTIRVLRYGDAEWVLIPVAVLLSLCSINYYWLKSHPYISFTANELIVNTSIFFRKRLPWSRIMGLDQVTEKLVILRLDTGESYSIRLQYLAENERRDFIRALRQPPLPALRELPL